MPATAQNLQESILYAAKSDVGLRRANNQDSYVVVVSPDELNRHLRTFIVAPLTTGSHPYPFRLPVRFGGKAGHIVLDQVRTIDRERIIRRLGALSGVTLEKTLGALQQMFAV